MSHPPPSQLKQFARQALGETEVISVLAHLAACDECLQMVAELDAEQIRQLAGFSEISPDALRPDSVLDEASFQRLVERACAITSDRQDASTPADPHNTDEFPFIPAEIGPYRLTDKLGEGGFGVVYAARQVHPIKRDVAIKLIKPGMDTRRVIARFDAERQTLAMMDHVNIAGVLDAGTTHSGHPYFVMELVDGQTITEHCEQQNLSVEDRIHLLIDVCRAVQHAHQKGIIHRDIKPSNVMVTVKDGQPTIKVIDFGVAKALDETLLATSAETRADHIVGTPLYMSPEQAAGEGIDTRSDVYALGALLYKLLTGTPPFGSVSDKKTHRPELLRAIAEDDPQRPSKRLADSHRSSTAAAILERDIDWIVLKALEKKSVQRYQSASELADDLRRSLDGEVVHATPPTFPYRARKFARKYRYSLATAATILALVIAGASTATWQAIRATHAEKKSAVALARNQRVLDFLTASFGRPDPYVEGRDVTIVSVLEPALDDLIKSKGEMSEDPMERASLLIAISDSLHSLGVYDRAIDGIKMAEQIHTEQLGQMAPQTLSTRHKLGSLLITDRQLDEAIPVLQDVIDRRTGTLGPWHQDTLQSQASLAIGYRFAGDLTKACQLEEEVLGLRREHLGTTHKNTITSMNSLGATYRELGRFDEAIELIEEAVRVRTEANGQRNHNTIVAMQNLASAYNEAEMNEKSLTQHETNLQLLRSIYSDTHPMTLRTLNDLAGAYVAANRIPDAVRVMESVLEAQVQAMGEDHPKSVITRNNLAWCYERAGRVAEAIPMYEQARRACEAEHGPDHPDTLTFMSNLAWAYNLEGRYGEAVVLNAETYAARAKKLGPDHPHTRLSLSRHAQDLREMGLPQLAIPEFKLELAKANELDDQHGIAWAKQRLGWSYMATGRADEATELLGSRWEQQSASLGSDHPDTLYSGRLYGFSQLAAGDHEQGLATLRENLKLERSRLQDDPDELADIMDWMARQAARHGILDFAEELLRESLTLHDSGWETGQTRNQLGEVLFKQERFEEAEPLLVEGYELMAEIKHGAYPLKRLKAAERVEQFYKATNEPEQKRWQAIVDERQAEVDALHDLARSTLIVEGG